MLLSQFLQSDYSDFASYSTIRMIASAIDGQKNASRKVIKTVLDKNIKNELKVSQLASRVAEYTEYLHGDASLQGVIVTMAQNYAGANNIPLLDREGNFGNRFINEASAPRYIYTNGSKELFKFFKKIDDNVLVKQYFEGVEIEPRFYLPSLPFILINGAYGIASGFAQKILPRNPKEIEKYIKGYLKGTRKKFNGIPYFEGFNGEIQQGGSSEKWLIKGKIKKLSATRIEITEVPIGYTLKGYLKVLDELEENEIISSYKDMSNDDSFHFIVNFKRGSLDGMTDDEILDKLKLIKKITENYTVLDENNRIKVFGNVSEIMDYYIEVKLKYLSKRKEYLMSSMGKEIREDISRYLFIKGIVEGSIIINNRPKKEIIRDIEKNPKIVKVDGSYDYLLNMRISTLTKEKMEELKRKILEKKEKLDIIKESPIEKLWENDLKENR